MKTPKIDSIEELNVLAGKSLRTLLPAETDREKCNAVVAVNSYVELHLLILNLLKVAVAALDADSQGITAMEGTAFAVKNVLELAQQLVPLEEAYFLDEVFNMVWERQME